MVIFSICFGEPTEITPSENWAGTQTKLTVDVGCHAEAQSYFYLTSLGKYRYTRERQRRAMPRIKDTRTTRQTCFTTDPLGRFLAQ